MKIIEILNKKKMAVSFEFFPPKTEQGEKELFENILSLKKLNPDYVSVTYGAGGSTRSKTNDIAVKISKEDMPKLNFTKDF
jgi:methylenetetrahydrofolate reductase (NADPH)